MITKTTIKLGDIDLDAYQIEDGSYAAPGLFRLMDTAIYRYQDSWYCLDPKVPPALGKYDFWDWDKEAFLAFEGNRFSYIHLHAVDTERGIDDDNVEISYVPLSRSVKELLDFCIQLRILPYETIARLRKTHDQCYTADDRLSRLAAFTDLLRDTSVSLFRLGLEQ